MRTYLWIVVYVPLDWGVHTHLWIGGVYVPLDWGVHCTSGLGVSTYLWIRGACVPLDWGCIHTSGLGAVCVPLDWVHTHLWTGVTYAPLHVDSFQSLDLLLSCPRPGCPGRLESPWVPSEAGTSTPPPPSHCMGSGVSAARVPQAGLPIGFSVSAAARLCWRVAVCTAGRSWALSSGLPKGGAELVFLCATSSRGPV